MIVSREPHTKIFSNHWFILFCSELTPCSLVGIYRLFGGGICLRFRVQVRRAKRRLCYKESVLLVRANRKVRQERVYTLELWRWMEPVPPKLLYAHTRLHCVTIHKTKVSTLTTVETSKCLGHVMVVSSQNSLYSTLIYKFGSLFHDDTQERGCWRLEMRGLELCRKGCLCGHIDTGENTMGGGVVYRPVTWHDAVYCLLFTTAEKS
jgi:hypothetical protein